MKKVKSFISLLMGGPFLFMMSCTDLSSGKIDNSSSSVEQEEKTIEDVLDFIVDVEAERDIRVLQLTDPQIIDSAQQRDPNRLGTTQTERWATEKMEDCLFKYRRTAVERAQPDLIVITGDLVYGEFDDAGTSLQALIQHMDSYQIPWAPVYGNHDNESRKGAIWQNTQLMNAEYCLFKKGETDGNGNYTVGLRQSGEIKRVFYMLDSNSCYNAHDAVKNEVIRTTGFTKTQLGWLYDLMEEIKEKNGDKPLPASACWHVPTQDFVDANSKYSEISSSFTINKTIKGDEGDFGSLLEDNGIKGPFDAPAYAGKYFIDQLKAYAVDSVFVGHSHQVNTSILYQGIRWTFGLKTGTYDRYNAGELGGTLITIGESVQVKHLYYDLNKQQEMDNLVWKD